MGKKGKKNASLGKHAAHQAAPSAESKKTEDAEQVSEEGEAQSGTASEITPPEPEASQGETLVQDSGMPAEGFAGFESSFDMLTKEKKHRGRKALKVLGIFLGSLVGIAAIVYAAGCFFFLDRFWPNTSIGAYDISMKTPTEAAPVLDKGIADYQVKVQGKGLSFEISAQDAELSFDADKILANAVEDVKPWMWPIEIFNIHDASSSLIAGYGKSGIEESVRAKVEEFNATATQPTSATIAFDETSQMFQIVPEVLGTALDPNSVVREVGNALITLNPTVQITDKHLVYPLVGEASVGLKRACDTANTMIEADMDLNMGGSTVAALDPATIASWVKLGENLDVIFDDAALNAWIEGVAAGCNTVGTTRTYTRPDGKVVTVDGGSYGWEIDTEAFATLVRDGVSTGKVGAFDIPVVNAGTGFQAIGSQDWGLRYCDIDLSEQHARFYDETGALVWESDIISGKPNGKHNTPTGVYMLNRKDSPSKLIGEIDPATKKPEYETVVSYWMPFVGNAIGLHDATWQPGFGGSMYANGYGSHGCINLPYYAAQELFAIIAIGDPVITHW